MPHSFKYGHSNALQWRDAALACLAQIGEIPTTANLGFIYVTDSFAPHLAAMLDVVKAATGIAHWVGSTGVGICSTGQEYLDQPAVAIMLGEFPQNTFQIFSTIRNADDIAGAVLVGNNPAYFGIVHGDPQNQQVAALIEHFAAKMESGFVVGGLTSSRNQNLQVADEITQGGLSGVVFSSDVAVATRLTQGVSQLGKQHEITECDNNVIIRIDGRPAFDVLKEEIGEVLSRDLKRIAGYIFVGLPVPGSDTGDYLVRNIIGIDVERKLIAVGEYLQPGHAFDVLPPRRRQRDRRYAAHACGHKSGVHRRAQRGGLLFLFRARREPIRCGFRRTENDQPRAGRNSFGGIFCQRRNLA